MKEKNSDSSKKYRILQYILKKKSSSYSHLYWLYALHAHPSLIAEPPMTVKFFVVFLLSENIWLKILETILNVNLKSVFVTAEWMYLATVWLSNSLMYALLNVSLKFRFIIQSQAHQSSETKMKFVDFFSQLTVVVFHFSSLQCFCGFFATDRAFQLCLCAKFLYIYIMR